MVVKIYIGNDRIDLFKDENISVKSAITDAEDISKNVGDYSFTFTVPASDNNNIIFKHYYNADVDNTFDARIKVDGRIELDGLPFKVGKWRLSKVSVKSGNPSSYTINFFGRLVSLKNIFKKDELTSLDFSAFNHDFTSVNVLTGLTDGLFSGSVKYPLLAKKQYYYNSDTSDDTFTATLANIAFNGEDVGVKWDDLQPSIKLIDIIEAIETKYDLAFSRHFFGASEFEQLYLWINKDEKIGSIGGGTIGIDWDSGDDDYINLTTDEGTFDVQFGYVVFPVPPYSITWLLTTIITVESGYESVPYSVVIYDNGVEIAREDAVGNSSTVTSLGASETSTLQEKVLSWEIVSEQQFAFSSRVIQTRRVRETSAASFTDTTYNTYGSVQSIDTVVEISEILPKIEVAEFLKGLFKMFKLIVIPTSDTDVYVNTLNGYYSEGRLQNITEYVNFESYDVKRGDILNEINFNFSDPETILNVEFEKNTGIAYGDEELKLADEDGEPLDGTKLEIKLPFEQIVYERLRDLDDDVLSNIMYGAIIDEEAEATTVAPHIHYIENQSVGDKTIGFIDNTGTVSEISTNVNIPNHTIDLTGRLYSTVFSAEYSEWDGQVINNTLYKNYYEDYVLSLFNIKRRSWDFKAVLPLNILASLELNDIIQIKERYYRIDNFNLNLTTGVSSLELINSFDNKINPFTATQTIFFIDSNERTMSSYISGEDLFTVDKNSVSGIPATWLTATIDGRNIIFEADENTTNTERVVSVFVENIAKTKNVTIFIIQEGNGVSSLSFDDAYNSQYLNTILIGKS